MVAPALSIARLPLSMRLTSSLSMPANRPRNAVRNAMVL